MSKRTFLGLAGLAVALACSSPVPAQEAADPLTRLLDSVLKRKRVEKPESGAEERASAQDPQPEPQAAPARQSAQPVQAPGRKTAEPKADPSPAPRRPIERAAIPAKAAPEQPKPAPAPQTVAAPTPAAPRAIPNSPEAAVERLNAYFNSIDVLTASFVQQSAGGRVEGTLYLKRPGQIHFAYAPPSSLEIVSDGRSVAVRDKKLGTNDVYPIGQTPLKFLVQDRFDLARDTKVRDVQTSPEGIITVRFDDSATFGGTSKITLRFDARANKLRQWTVLDPQGFETSVILSDVNVVQRPSAGAMN